MSKTNPYVPQESVTSKFGKMGTLLKKKVPDYNMAQKAWVVVDCLFNRAFCGVTMTDYFQYEFYEKNLKGRAKYTTWGKLHKFAMRYNDAEESKIFDDKTRFIKVFKEYIGRDALDIRNASFDEFKAFIGNKEKIFVKPIGGSWGIGAQVQNVDQNELKDLYDRLHNENVLVEEVIQQHPEMAAFNDTSTNTIRVCTFVKEDGTSVVMPGAVIRIGRKGKIADNFHHQGIGAGVDSESGIIFTQGIDKTGARYNNHPDSGKQIMGFQVPLWDQVCDTVRNAALVCPKVRYVGWDVALTADNKVVLIEGNDRADPDLAQMSSGKGNWEVFSDLAKSI